MKLLVIGGTHFVGRHAVEQAVERGHDVTVFHRGGSEPGGGFPDIEHVHGDRDGGLSTLEGRAWDAALDTCGYVPRVVRQSVRLPGLTAGQYTFVSSLSVYPDDVEPGATEGTPGHGPPFPDTEEITDDSYGPLKVACELEVQAAFDGPSSCVLASSSAPTIRSIGSRIGSGGPRWAVSCSCRSRRTFACSSSTCGTWRPS